MCSLVCEFLGGQGYSVHCAANGRAGLRDMFERKPTLVLLDVTMPQVDGWETLRRIREVSDVPINMLTARDDEVSFVRRYIWHLRQKVERDPDHPQYIHNERGYGYRFQADE